MATIVHVTGLWKRRCHGHMRFFVIQSFFEAVFSLNISTLSLINTLPSLYHTVDPAGPRTARAAALLTEAQKSTGFQTRSLRVNKFGDVFKFVPRIPTRTQ